MQHSYTEEGSREFGYAPLFSLYNLGLPDLFLAMQAQNKALLQEEGSSGDEDEDATETPQRKSKTSPIVLSDDEAALAQELNHRKVNSSSSSGLPDFVHDEEDTIEQD